MLDVDADTADGIAAVNASFTLSDEHLWNNRLFMTSGPLKVVDHTHQPIAETYGDICPRQRKQYDSGSTWASDITPPCTDRTMTVGCCTTTFPSMTSVALLPYPVVGDDRTMPLSRAMQGGGTLARESWQTSGCAIVTRTEMRSNTNMFWADLANKDFHEDASGRNGPTSRAGCSSCSLVDSVCSLILAYFAGHDPANTPNLSFLHYDDEIHSLNKPYLTPIERKRLSQLTNGLFIYQEHSPTSFLRTVLGAPNDTTTFSVVAKHL